MTVKAVCWDWNGTLLDDVARCLRVMNLMLADFGRPRIADAAAYRAVFRFPLDLFYADVGIEPGEYRAAVDRYLELLTADTTDVPLHGGAREALDRVRSRGIAQVLASATLAPLLEAQLRPHRLAGSFDRILSITDAHRASKRDVIAAWLEGTGYEPADVLLIGDTDHDLEIARELGTRFVHFEGGHQALSDGDVVSIRALGQLERVLDG
ncbi:HAD family hydrolase [Microbacterium kyungheense]|jgi:phosphoglycolate phosphatase|uniref:Phosphoglycolate phosphatase n=1 Tax=Microbacterium kyungheense TaxID=1263636 RepID=A0A543F1G0_9MICO|nr:HAD hydrolase-like protein [Microbacterium kyungheense]TQM27675.1 phosphoglycolate phosphatase [Microbacterium kyungheense]